MRNDKTGLQHQRTHQTHQQIKTAPLLFFEPQINQSKGIGVVRSDRRVVDFPWPLFGVSQLICLQCPNLLTARWAILLFRDAKDGPL